jgi:hypothetical protein
MESGRQRVRKGVEKAVPAKLKIPSWHCLKRLRKNKKASVRIAGHRVMV